MSLKSHKTYRKGEEGFEKVLTLLEKKYYHNGGCPDAEVIINWNKREAKEDGVVSLYATNSVICNAIRRCRPGIRSVEVHPVGATLFIDTKHVRPLHTVLKVAR